MQPATSPKAKSRIRLAVAAAFAALAAVAVTVWLSRQEAVQARDHAAAPRAGIHFAIDHDPRIDAGHFVDDVLELDVGTQALLFLEQALLGGPAARRRAARLDRPRSVTSR